VWDGLRASHDDIELHQEAPPLVSESSTGCRQTQEVVDRLDINQLPANGDGAVTFDEYQKAPFASKLGEDALEDRFEKLDRNGDKKLTAEDAPEPGPDRPRTPRQDGEDRQGPRPAKPE
jgi:hypothetical protein